MVPSGTARIVAGMTVVNHEGRPCPGPGDGERQTAHADRGVEANARLTAAAAVVLFVLLALEGFTILGVRQLLTPHVFIGMLLIPPVIVKIASTSYRFARYYLGDPVYRRKGPPPLLLRLLGPLVVVLTLVVLASGVALLLAPASFRQALLFVHKASFVLWFVAMAIHVLGHLVETARIAPLDWARRTRRQVRGASARLWILAASLAVGVLLGSLVVGQVGPWLTSAPAPGH